ncbi:MAG: MMPL family transporter, partial [Lachnospiraceae bacterium]|nr:MMPL family transporter [Lachnospiraceae bacterium]
MKIGKWIAKNRILILIVGAVLIIPSLIGFAGTKVNYDLLSYLPDTLETVKGQNIMVDEYGMGAFAMIVTEGMPLKDVKEVESAVSGIDHVKKVLWYGTIADISVPPEMLPERLRTALFNNDATLLIAFMDDTTSSDAAMGAVREMRRILSEKCFISGMTGIVTDIADLCMQELPVYVVIAAVLCFAVLILTTESFIVPVFFLLSIGISILYNLGSNFLLGQISYVTQALTAVLQLAVTMDYSIFLLETYEECKTECPNERNEAMGIAISRTFKSVISSSVTTVAGFLALCVMTFALGRDIGIVMSKGVLIGVICCVTILPAMILVFDGLIEKTKHRPLVPDLGGVSAFITKHHRLWLIIFAILLVPSIYGSTHTKVYYNIAKSLPDDILSNQANKKLEDDFSLNCLHIIMMDRNTDIKDKRKMLEDVESVDGVKWALGIPSVLGPAVPEQMVPEKLKNMLQSDAHDLAFVCSE